MTALATAADLIRRSDARMLGDLVGDSGTRVSATALLSDQNLAAALDDAWGEVIAALKMSRRYTDDDLAALADESKQYLIRINCQIAVGYLWERRPWSDDDQRAHAVSRADAARKQLDDLRTGKTVLNLDAPQDAGLPEIRQPSVSSITRANLVVDDARRGFYLNRRYQT